MECKCAKRWSRYGSLAAPGRNVKPCLQRPGFFHVRIKQNPEGRDTYRGF
nr:MAG TPA: hypothetical protein [Caudoviricetes sp.]